MISYAEALAIVQQQVAPLASEWVSSTEAEGRILAQHVSSPDALPPFDNSAMDGVALATAGNGARAGSDHVIAGTVAAGDVPATADGAAWEIMTGAALPAGADAVVPIEQLEILAQHAERPSLIRLRADVRAGQHIRRRGEDVAVHDRVIEAGTLLRGAHAMVLAALGCARVPVMRQPRVALIATGRELVTDPEQPLLPGQIRDGTSHYLLSQLRAAGARVVWQAQVGDDALAFDAALAQARQAGADVILSTGAVSRGRYDFVPDALARHNAQCLFHKVAVRPGKPVLLARLPDGVLYVGLPGNPMASAAGLRFFVEPALRGLLGMPHEHGLPVALHAPLPARPVWRQHLRAQLTCSATGMLSVQVLPQQESFRVAPLLQANVWAVVEPQPDGAAPSTVAQVYGLGHLQPAAPALVP
ncbi:molybdopterin molybdotransferase MoeA [Xanthomonas campestris]|uniref:molybdopterin molybdotransferase MoeA n=1 Tax=Xanthomonas campestris TaxID=339 RepID=UPI00096CBE1A|nr:molybdopterin molybdotransferase MoeA [Xanthomonas campestris]MCF8826543.1 molybdopterin molybdotransferase MoeA [Xanthomonas campestris pv. raphani]MEA9839035.1 molybdopterin molybdotransferase MoeA [Xanthomonas campestris pv. raphani]MEA9876686.1 molybdopterin molybdotransferase MoeA [Xanthomonas campestris pv. raphani]MEA9892482.1 molybdopterin molybdotransferase MoeA [Xanthomonas campestris pv. raphani]MEA9934147.1 molybdopterin molybdotransferase MoeA [Xanthomonas campestris pv. raphan